MKSLPLSGKIQSGAHSVGLAKKMMPCFAVCVVLALGNWTAMGGAPALSLPASVTLGEDNSTNMAFGVTDAGQPIFTVATTAKSSNTNLINNTI